MTGDDTVRLTYTELAEARGISLASARRMVHRHKWPKQIGNDGLTRVSIPVSALDRPESASSDASDDIIDDAIEGATDDAAIAVIPGATIGAAPVQVVPLDEAVAAFGKATSDAITGAINGATTGVIMALQESITTLRVELYSQRDRAEAAEKQL